MLKRILTPMAIVAIALTALVLVWNSDIWLFLDMYAFILVPVLGTAYALGTSGFREGMNAFVAPLDRSASERDLRASSSFFEALGKSYACFSVLGSTISVVDMLKNLADKSRVGPRMAVALISIEYAALLTLFVVLPYRFAIKRRLAEGA
ncbi:MAG: hypothetical protein Q8M76_16680 [Spirochaetaceae bacterium]|nr:hypothetical protein [Spirochaetaceae bacterium]